MKTLLLGLILTFSFSATARELKACSSSQLVSLEESIADWVKEGFTEVNYLTNSKDVVVGFYAWSKEGGMISEVCEYVGQDDLTVADTWYYWDNDDTSENPSTWTVGESYRISQDEGIAYFEVLSVSDVSVEARMTVIGWDEDSADHEVRNTVVTFKRK